MERVVERNADPVKKPVLIGGLLISMLLAGCSAPPPKTVVKLEPSVTPVPLSRVFSATSDSGSMLANLLLDHYLTAPFYKMANPLMLARYQAGDSALSSDGKQLLQLYKSDTSWGFVSVSTGYSPIVNMFELFDGHKTNYALVLKDVKICMVEGADRAPKWNGTQLLHSKVQPGKFECSGSTRTSLFQAGSGMPGRLGIYFESGDTVLYDSDRQRLERIAALMAQRFSHLSIPEAI